jgi:hypothetical protein
MHGLKQPLGTIWVKCVPDLQDDSAVAFVRYRRLLQRPEVEFLVMFFEKISRFLPNAIHRCVFPPLLQNFKVQGLDPRFLRSRVQNNTSACCVGRWGHFPWFPNSAVSSSFWRLLLDTPQPETPSHSTQFLSPTPSSTSRKCSILIYHFCIIYFNDK